MLKFMSRDASGGHSNQSGMRCHPRPRLCPSLCCCRGKCWGPGFTLTKFVLMSEAYITTKCWAWGFLVYVTSRSSVDICDRIRGPSLGLWLYCDHKPWSWTVQMPETMWKPITHAPVVLEEQIITFVVILIIANTVEEREHGRLLWQHLLPPELSHKQKK